MVTRVFGVVLAPIRRRQAGVLSPRRKAAAVREIGRTHGLATLVETGTYRGTTVAACLGAFEHIDTIELDVTLAAAARRRFSTSPAVTVIAGDSSLELARLAATLAGPTLFWLDAHHSAGVTPRGQHDLPLEWELGDILDRGEADVVLVDDARHLGRLPGHPSLERPRSLAGARASSFEVRDDIVRIVLDAAGPQQPG